MSNSIITSLFWVRKNWARSIPLEYESLNNIQDNKQIKKISKISKKLKEEGKLTGNETIKESTKIIEENEVEEMLIFKKIKENIKIYKKIKLTKLSQYTGIDFNILLKIIKKKCMEGELNVKYDEENDIIDVLDVDPGKKEKVKKSQELYKSIIEGNKNYFISLRNKKLKELNNEGMMNMINFNNIEDDDEENGGFFP